MINSIKRLTIIISLISLAACGGGDGDGGGDNTSSITLVNAYGVDVTANSIDLQSGISTDCYTETGDPTTGFIQTMQVIDSAYTFTSKAYGNDSKCADVADTTGEVKGTIVVGASAKLKGWLTGSNDNPDTTAPNKASDSSTPIADDASYSPLTVTITSLSANITNNEVGDVITTGFVIDDSLPTGVILYNVTSSNNTTWGAGYGRTEDPYKK